MGSLGLTCDQVKINFPVGIAQNNYPPFYEKPAEIFHDSKKEVMGGHFI
jgi:hypothetical protein